MQNPGTSDEPPPCNQYFGPKPVVVAQSIPPGEGLADQSDMVAHCFRHGYRIVSHPAQMQHRSDNCECDLARHGPIRVQCAIDDTQRVRAEFGLRDWPLPSHTCLHRICTRRTSKLRKAEASLDAIVTALIENSRQAGANRIAFHIEAKEDLICLSAKDDGIGIPAADRNRVFEPFFTTKRASGGSGLGLPIVKSLVEAAGGDLRLEDSEAGAHFSLDLPVAS